MVLRVRNRLLVAILIVSSLLLAASLLSIFNFISRFGVVPIPTDLRVSILPLPAMPFSPNTVATLASIVMLAVYVPFAAFFALRKFEKTMASELQYFASFLIAVGGDLFRLPIYFHRLWTLYSFYYEIVATCWLAGKFVAAASLLYISSSAYSLQSRKFPLPFAFPLAISLFFALTIPIYCNTIYSSLACEFAFSTEVGVVLLFAPIVAVMEFRFRGSELDVKQRRKTALSFVLLIIGFYLLSYCDNFPQLVIGVVALFGGTAFFLLNLRKYYLWM